MRLLERWDRRNQRVLQEHNAVSWEEFAAPPKNRLLRAYYRFEAVKAVVVGFVFLAALIVWGVRAIQ